jgi:hydrogenase maturation protein HypF
MCTSCSKEFRDPSSRRFHAQTIACPQCGPRVFLTDRDGKDLVDKDPIRTVGRLLEEGYIVAIKGYGGFHVATASTISDPIQKLRGVKHRSQKPFAIMARDIGAIRSFANIREDEERLLASPAKPIVLVEKSDYYYLSSLISPSLDRVGVMLPYTGLHLMLFDRVKEPAFVMTSANPPNEPIITQNREAVTRLGFIVDYFLFHDREIAQRCDDSVTRMTNGRKSFVRRSRGYAPTPIRLGSRCGSVVLGLGAELNVTSCVLIDDKAFISQHIGDVETPETYQFLKDATKHLLALTNAKLDAVGCDLHPLFNTSRFAHEFGEEKDLPVLPVQHHYAHVSGLMFEHSLGEIVGIACDGYGYGIDGNAWGGEIIYGGAEGFKRLGHLQEQPMVGGDLATKYPLRMAIGILKGFDGWEEWLQSKALHFRHHEREVELVISQLKHPERLQSTTSCGRVLDAVAAILKVCFERSYEGEPAMKLEAAAKGGRDVLHLEPIFDDKFIDTRRMVQTLFELRDKESVRDLAFSAQAYLATALAHFAVNEAKSLGTRDVGFTGGVAYNNQMVSTIEKIVHDEGLKFVIPVQIPCGDGGSSFGQACAASLTFSKK